MGQLGAAGWLTGGVAREACPRRLALQLDLRG